MKSPEDALSRQSGKGSTRSNHIRKIKRQRIHHFHEEAEQELIIQLHRLSLKTVGDQMSNCNTENYLRRGIGKHARKYRHLQRRICRRSSIEVQKKSEEEQVVYLKDSGRLEACVQSAQCLSNWTQCSGWGQMLEEEPGEDESESVQVNLMQMDYNIEFIDEMNENEQTVQYLQFPV